MDAVPNRSSMTTKEFPLCDRVPLREGDRV